jgi:uncharacterized membrane protein
MRILHILFIITVIISMVIILIPAIMLYMFTGQNAITEIQIAASNFERKYFNE